MMVFLSLEWLRLKLEMTVSADVPVARAEKVAVKARNGRRKPAYFFNSTP